nr:hypothetical protein [Streptomyces sp. Je 1-4 4N24_ara]
MALKAAVGQDLIDPPVRVSHVVSHGDELEMVVHTQVGVASDGVADDGDPGAHLGGVLIDDPAVEQRGAGGRFVPAGGDAQQRGFPGAVVSEESGAGTDLDLQVQGLQRLAITVGAADPAKLQ